jgi:hypothetical protein
VECSAGVGEAEPVVLDGQVADEALAIGRVATVKISSGSVICGVSLALARIQPDGSSTLNPRVIQVMAFPRAPSLRW